MGETIRIVGNATANAKLQAFNHSVIKLLTKPILKAVITNDIMQDIKKDIKKENTNL
jgi:hypothetical protein